MDRTLRWQNRPRTAALLLAVAWLVVTVVAALALTALAPSWTGTVRSLVVTVVLAIGVALLLTGLRAWEQAGFTPRRQWQDVQLLWLPAVLVVIPLVTGVKPVHPGFLAILLVGETLTAFIEEAYFRGLVLRVLRRTGALPAVLLSSVLFGAVHLGNVFFRDSVVLVAAQAVGAFCFGIGYASLRLRTGTLWPLIALHMLGNTTAALGALPAIPILVGQDVVLLVYGLLLIRAHRDHSPEPTGESADPAGARPLSRQIPTQRSQTPSQPTRPPARP